jgi:hypothetical protein
MLKWFFKTNDGESTFTSGKGCYKQYSDLSVAKEFNGIGMTGNYWVSQGSTQPN